MSASAVEMDVSAPCSCLTLSISARSSIHFGPYGARHSGRPRRRPSGGRPMRNRRQLRRDMLAEQARNMLTMACEENVHGPFISATQLLRHAFLYRLGSDG
jgi:hypothetical protein